MSNVVELDQPTKVKTPVNVVLARAAGLSLQDIVVMGWKPNGELYFASSDPDGANALWLIKKAEHTMMVVGE